MLGLKYRAISIKTISFFFAIALVFNLVGCDKINLPSGIEGFSVPDIKNVSFDNSGNGLAEVAPPKVVQKLAQILGKYHPQVSILSPRLNSTIQDTTVEVELEVADFALFKDDRLGMGNHLNLILDNEPYGEIYNLDQPIVLTDLKPGTHSLRVLVEKPWHESFKNKEAYAQVTFNVLTETENNSPTANIPLLTYNQPNGIYSAEPILLDFYLTNVNEDWQVKGSVNGKTFIIDEWQPTYLKGFQQGNNLIELELLDDEGKPINNAFNKIIRLITYNPESSSQDTLAQLMSDRLTFEEAVAIAEQNYYLQPVGEPETIETITEELSIEAPEEVEIEDKTEDLPIITPEESTEIEEITEEISDTENPETARANQEKDLTVTDNEPKIIDSTKEILTTPEITTSETTINPINPIDPQELAKQNIPAKYFSRKDNVSNTSVIEKTPSLKQENLEIETIEEIPSPEAIAKVDTKIEATNLEESQASDTIIIEIPKPKLKVPQWWKDLVANLQQRFNR